METGKIISTHFRRFWGINQPDEVIAQAGFVFSEEPGKPLLVIGYPDCFREEMQARMHMYFEQKKMPVVVPEKSPPKPTSEKKERKRIPAKKIPAYTTKKS